MNPADKQSGGEIPLFIETGLNIVMENNRAALMKFLAGLELEEQVYMLNMMFQTARAITEQLSDGKPASSIAKVIMDQVETGQVALAPGKAPAAASSEPAPGPAKKAPKAEPAPAVSIPAPIPTAPVSSPISTAKPAQPSPKVPAPTPKPTSTPAPSIEPEPPSRVPPSRPSSSGVIIVPSIKPAPETTSDFISPDDELKKRRLKASMGEFALKRLSDSASLTLDHIRSIGKLIATVFNLSPQEIAAQAGVSLETLANIEKCEGAITDPEVQKVITWAISSSHRIIRETRTEDPKYYPVAAGTAESGPVEEEKPMSRIEAVQQFLDDLSSGDVSAKALAKAVRLIQKDQGLTDDDVALRIGITKPQLKLVLNGSNAFRGENGKKVKVWVSQHLKALKGKLEAAK